VVVNPYTKNFGVGGKINPVTLILMAGFSDGGGPKVQRGLFLRCIIITDLRCLFPVSF